MFCYSQLGWLCHYGGEFAKCPHSQLKMLNFRNRVLPAPNMTNTKLILCAQHNFWQAEGARQSNPTMAKSPQFTVYIIFKFEQPMFQSPLLFCLSKVEKVYHKGRRPFRFQFFFTIFFSFSLIMYLCFDGKMRKLPR